MKYLPWLMTGGLAAALVAIVFIFQQKIASKDAEITQVRSQLQDLELQANAKIEEANHRYNNLVEDANKKLRAASMREVDVRVRFRAAFLSTGNVAMITNTGSRAAEYRIAIERPSTEKRLDLDVVLDSNATKEIGEKEGWPFISGDRVTVNQTDHKSLSFSLP